MYLPTDTIYIKFTQSLRTCVHGHCYHSTRSSHRTFQHLIWFFFNGFFFNSSIDRDNSSSSSILNSWILPSWTFFIFDASLVITRPNRFRAVIIDPFALITVYFSLRIGDVNLFIFLSGTNTVSPIYTLCSSFSHLALATPCHDDMEWLTLSSEPSSWNYDVDVTTSMKGYLECLHTTNNRILQLEVALEVSSHFLRDFIR